MIRLSFIVLFSLILLTVKAQKQYTYPLKTLDGPDGMVIDNDQNIYIANWGKGGKGSTVTCIDKNGREIIYLDSLASPDGLAFDKKGNLYVSCFASGEIIKITPDKKRTRFASGLNHPSDLKFASDGNLYVSIFGNYNGTHVVRISPTGEQTIFAEGFTVPLGLAFDKDQNLYVSNFGSGSIDKISKSGTRIRYAQLPNDPAGYFQYLAFDNNGNLYCPSYAHNCIYRIDRLGKVSVLSIPEENGGQVKLDGPNSIYFHDGQLYFTEFNSGRLKRVTIDK